MYIFIFGSALYVLSVLVPSIISTYSNSQLELMAYGNLGSGEGNGTFQYAGILFLCLGAVGLRDRDDLYFIKNNPKLVAALLAIFIYHMFWFLAAASIIRAQQTAQLLFTEFVFYKFCLIWQRPDNEIKYFLYTVSSIVAGCLLLGLVMHGLPQNRWVGTLHPNFFARSAWIAGAFYLAGRKRFSLIAIAGCLLASFIVLSRTMILATLALAFFIHILDWNYKRTISKMAVLLSPIPFIIMIAGLTDIGSSYLEKIGDALELTSSSRGLNSGFSGRTTIWENFFVHFDEFALAGGGFRSVRYTDLYLHSGFLAYFADFGVILGSFIYFGIIARLLWILYAAREMRDYRGLIMGIIGICSIFIQFSEPDNFNLGLIGSFGFVVALSYCPPRERVLAVKSSFYSYSKT